MMIPEYPSQKSADIVFSIPTIMPDEYWKGYLGRLLIFNGINHGIGHVAANQLLTNLVCEIAADIYDIPILVKLARLLKIEVATFVNRHSLIPFIQNSKIKNFHKRIHANSFLLIKNECYFCVRCSSEDLDFPRYGGHLTLLASENLIPLTVPNFKSKVGQQFSLNIPELEPDDVVYPLCLNFFILLESCLPAVLITV